MIYSCQHFKLHELVDRFTYQQKGERAWMFFDDEYLQMIDGIWEYFNASTNVPIPMIINNWYWHGEYQWSGLRTLYCTEGSRWSLHRLAKAADIKCKIPADEMRKEIIKHQDDPLLKWINRMEDKKDWLHVDRANVEGRIILF